MKYKIKEIQILNDLCNEMQIHNILIDINEKASWHVEFFDSKENIMISRTLETTPEEYNQWGFDDNYIIELTCFKLGIDLI